jgi:hypothetical protein
MGGFVGWEDELAQLTALCTTFGDCVDASGIVPYPNPIGLPEPKRGQVGGQLAEPTLGAS